MPWSDEERRKGPQRGGIGPKVPERTDGPAPSTGADVEETLDKVVTELGDRTPEITRKAKILLRETGRRIKELDDKSENYSERIFRSKSMDTLMEGILKFRGPIFVITIVVCLLIGYMGIIGPDYLPQKLAGEDVKPNLQQKIRGDFEVYLPFGSDAEKVLTEMKVDWSTDLATIFIETPNKYDPTDETNITDYSVLKEISDIEEALNFNKTDKGSVDGIIFCFSISTLIKTLHNASNAISVAFLNELPRELVQFSLPDQLTGNYSIPTDQNLIDQFFNAIGPEKIGSLVADINNDGIYDSALILMGLSKKVDQDKLITNIEDKIAPYFVDPGVRPGSKDTTKQWERRYDRGEVHCRMTLTGPTPLARMISQRTMREMVTVFPWALLMVGASLLIFHRTLKIWLITLLPILFSLIVSFGMMGIFLPILTPQVVLVAPILIALGVAYGLYIANRYAEESASIPDKEMRIRYALKTTGRAIFLSAATTAFGFGSMLTVNMPTMQVLGFGLSTGIMACYVTTILITPTLVIWLNYKKSPKADGGQTVSPVSKRIGQIPIKHSRKIIIGALILAIFSIALSPPSPIPLTDIEVGGLSVVTANMDYIMLSPADEPVVQKMAEQSDTFGSGQIGLMLVRGSPSLDIDKDGRHDAIDDSMKDNAVLIKLERLMTAINGNGTEGDEGLKNAQGVSIVDIMKMVQIPDFTNTPYYQELLIRAAQISEDAAELFDQWVRSNVVKKSFWVAWNNVPDDSSWAQAILKEDLKVFLVNIFYNSLGIEIKGMLVNDDYSKTIVYMNMPNMDIIDTERVVNNVDRAISTEGDFIVSSKEGGGVTASPLSGFGKVLVAVNEVIVEKSNQSTITAWIMIFLILLLFFRSWRVALITMIPVTLVIFWQYVAIFGVGQFGELIWGPEDNMFSGDLNLFTALIGSIIAGTGVDFSIHITERIRQKNMQIEGVVWAAETSGWSFIEATATMVMGMTAVFLINIPSIREFILLIMILLAFSAYSAIFILTSVYRLYLPRYNRLQTLKKVK
ncbi:MAG: MMPL family transporter [Candidatus Thermoplasmatota archaeon]|nr:MMPL family transporter [Candidatus Thermoplasmatota archaeon]